MQAILIHDKKPYLNSKVYIEVNGRRDVWLKGSYVVSARLGIMNVAIKRAIETHMEKYPKEPVTSIRFVGRQKERVIEI